MSCAFGRGDAFIWQGADGGEVGSCRRPSKSYKRHLHDLTNPKLPSNMPSKARVVIFQGSAAVHHPTSLKSTAVPNEGGQPKITHNLAGEQEEPYFTRYMPRLPAFRAPGL